VVVIIGVQSNGFTGVAGGSPAAAITVIGLTAENRVFLQFFCAAIVSRLSLVEFAANQRAYFFSVIPPAARAKVWTTASASLAVNSQWFMRFVLITDVSHSLRAEAFAQLCEVEAGGINWFIQRGKPWAGGRCSLFHFTGAADAPVH